MKPVIAYLDDTRGDDMYTAILEGMLETAAREGVRLVRFGYTPNAVDEATGYERLFSLIRAARPDGLIFLGWTRAGAMYNREALLSRMGDIRLMSLGSEFPDIPSILYRGDDHIAQMVEHLVIRHGYRRIAYMEPARADTRKQAWWKTLQTFGLAFPELEIPQEAWGVTGSARRVERFLEILLDERGVALDAIVSSGQLETEALVGALAKRRLRIPEDIALTGYVDTDFERYATPGITTIDYPWSDMGRIACQRMVDWIRTGVAPQSGLLPGRILIRESCGCISELVHQAAVGPVAGEESDIGDLSPQRRAELLEPLKEAFPYPSLSFDALLEALLQDQSAMLSGEPYSSLFLEVLSDQLSLSPPFVRQARLETMVLRFRAAVMPWLVRNPIVLRQMGELFRRGQSMLLNVIAQSRGHAGIRAKNLIQAMQETAQALMTAHSRQGIQDALMDNLSKLQIPFCAVILFPDVHENTREAIEAVSSTAEALSGECLLVDVRNRTVVRHARRTAREVLEQVLSQAERQVVQILPLELASKYEVFAVPLEQRRGTLAVSSATGAGLSDAGTRRLQENGKEMNWLGYVLFESGPSDEQVYRAIASHLCSALENTAMAEALEANYLKLMDQAFAEGLSDVVSHALHHAGNAFNSVHASVQGLSWELARSPLPDLLRAEGLLEAVMHAGMSTDAETAQRTARLLTLFQLLGGRAVKHRDAMMTHLQRIMEKAGWMDGMITLQQGYAVSEKVEEQVPLTQVLEDALRVHVNEFPRCEVTVDRTLRVGLAHVVPRGKAFVLLSFLLAWLGRSSEESQLLHISLDTSDQQAALRFSMDSTAMAGFADALAAQQELERQESVQMNLNGVLSMNRKPDARLDLSQAEHEDAGLRRLLAAMRQMHARVVFEKEPASGEGTSESTICVLILPRTPMETGETA